MHFYFIDIDHQHHQCIHSNEHYINENSLFSYFEFKIKFDLKNFVNECWFFFLDNYNNNLPLKLSDFFVIVHNKIWSRINPSQIRIVIDWKWLNFMFFDKKIQHSNRVVHYMIISKSKRKSIWLNLNRLTNQRKYIYMKDGYIWI